MHKHNISFGYINQEEELRNLAMTLLPLGCSTYSSFTFVEVLAIEDLVKNIPKKMFARQIPQ